MSAQPSVADKKFERYRNRVEKRIRELTEVLAGVSTGDFSKNLRIPAKSDEFSELFVGVQVMIEVIRENLAELHALNNALTKNVAQAEGVSRSVQQEKVIDEAILASIGEGLIVTDNDERIVIVNRQAEEMLGLSDEEIVGRTVAEIITPHDANHRRVPEQLLPVRLAHTSGKKVSDTGLYFSTARVKDLPVAVTASPITLGRSLLGVVTVFRDVREEREIDQAKTEVVSFTSHQLRTPLSVINWYSEVLLGNHLGRLNAKQREYMNVILFTARRMIELVNTFLSVSRIQLNTLVMDIHDVVLPEIIDSVLEELNPQIQQRQLKLTLKIEKNLPKIKTDPKLIRVVFQNLVNNAVKYTPNGGDVIVSITPAKPNRHVSFTDGVLVTITDTGYGIPPKAQAKVFTKLFRAENAQQIDTEGAGLGLYMVKSIVNYAGGEVWFRSALNKGTSFFVALPSVPVSAQSQLTKPRRVRSNKDR